MELGITGVAGITAVCYLVGLTVKATKLDNKWIPVIVGALGGALCLVGLYVMGDFPATEPLTAVAVGIVSGLAATGTDQVIHQLKGE